MPEISDDELKRFQGFEAQARSLGDENRTLKQQMEGMVSRSDFDSVSSERDRYKSETETALAQNNALRVGSAFSQALTAAGVLPQYQDRFSDQVGGLKLEGDRVVTADGKPLSDFASGLRSQYPAMFAAEANPTGSGAAPGGSTGQTTTTAPRVIKPENGVIVGVNPDDLISGSVKVEV